MLTINVSIPNLIVARPEQFLTERRNCESRESDQQTQGWLKTSKLTIIYTCKRAKLQRIPTDDTDVISLPQGLFARHARSSLPLKLQLLSDTTGGTCTKIAKNSFYKTSAIKLDQCLGKRCSRKVIKSNDFDTIRKMSAKFQPQVQLVSLCADGPLRY